MLALGIVSCAVNQPPGTDISKAGQLSLWKKPHSATPNTESLKLEITFIVFVIRDKCTKPVASSLI